MSKAARTLVYQEVLDANARYAKNFGDKGKLALPPARRFAILTCMDARLDPAKFAGLAEGDAHVIRNAGGRASDDAIRSLVISHKLLGTREWYVIHHTDCGMELFTDQIMGDLLADSLATAAYGPKGWRNKKAAVKPEPTFTDAAAFYLERSDPIHPFDIRKVEILAEYFLGRPLRELDGAAFAAFVREKLPLPRIWTSLKGRRIEQQPDGPVKPYTVARWRATLRAVLRHYAANHADTLIRDIPTPSIGKPKPVFLSWGEAERLIEAYHPMLRPLATMLCFQGCRIGEALKLRWDDVSIERRWIRFTQTKGRRGEGEYRTVPMHERTGLALSRINREREGHVFLTPQGEPYRPYQMRGGSPIKRAHREALKRAQLRRRFKVHHWRSHWASWMVMEASADTHSLMELGGWRYPASVKHYVALNPEHLRDTLARLRPR